jgi:hypothetical protein
MEIVFIVIAGSFMLHMVGGIFVLAPLYMFIGEEKLDKLPIIRTLEDPKFDEWRQVIYYPILAVLGALFFGVMILIVYIGDITSPYVSYAIVFMILAGFTWGFIDFVRRPLEATK